MPFTVCFLMCTPKCQTPGAKKAGYRGQSVCRILTYSREQTESCLMVFIVFSGNGVSHGLESSTPSHSSSLSVTFPELLHLLLGVLHNNWCIMYDNLERLRVSRMIPWNGKFMAFVFRQRDLNPASAIWVVFCFLFVCFFASHTKYIESCVFQSVVVGIKWRKLTQACVFRNRVVLFCFVFALLLQTFEFFDP